MFTKESSGTSVTLFEIVRDLIEVDQAPDIDMADFDQELLEMMESTRRFPTLYELLNTRGTFFDPSTAIKQDRELEKDLYSFSRREDKTPRPKTILEIGDQDIRDRTEQEIFSALGYYFNPTADILDNEDNRTATIIRIERHLGTTFREKIIPLLKIEFDFDDKQEKNESVEELEASLFAKFDDFTKQCVADPEFATKNLSQETNFWIKEYRLMKTLLKTIKNL